MNEERPGYSEEDALREARAMQAKIAMGSALNYQQAGEILSGGKEAGPHEAEAAVTVEKTLTLKNQIVCLLGSYRVSESTLAGFQLNAAGYDLLPAGCLDRITAELGEDWVPEGKIAVDMNSHIDEGDLKHHTRYSPARNSNGQHLRLPIARGLELIPLPENAVVLARKMSDQELENQREYYKQHPPASLVFPRFGVPSK